MISLYDHPFTPLIQKLKHVGELQSIKIVPEKNCPEIEVFNNVQRKVQKRGGEAVLGWKLTRNPYFIQAEYHAVYRSRNGYLVDITESKDAQTFFLETNDFEYRWPMVVRVPLTESIVNGDLIALLDAIDDFKNKNADSDGVIRNGFSFNLMFLEHVTSRIFEIIDNNSRCFCDSKKSYEKCHHLGMRLFIERMLSEVDHRVYMKQYESIFSIRKKASRELQAL